MLIDGLATMVAGFAIFSILGAKSAPCSSFPIKVDVASTADVQGLTANMSCTGEGVFDVTWYGSLEIEQTIVVSDQKSVTVTGSSSLSTSTADPDANEPDATINAVNSTRIFLVSNGSTLTLNNLVLNGGYSAESGGGVAVLSSAFLNVFGCVFTNNQAATTGGAISASSSTINIIGNDSFENNSAIVDGGAISGASDSTISISGNTLFSQNSANDSGGAIYVRSSGINIGGNTSFKYNSAYSVGGALYTLHSIVRIGDNALFKNNSALTSNGGAIASSASDINLEGNTYFEFNSAFDNGGAIAVYFNSNASISGNTLFANNSANDNGDENGQKTNLVSDEIPTRVDKTNRAIHVHSANINIEGTASFEHNSADSDGGAINVHEADISVEGTTSFKCNSAHSTGGAMNTRGSNTTINGSAVFSFNEAVNAGGGIYSSQGSIITTFGNLYFDQNTAGDSGGGMYLTDPDVFNISGVTFRSNEAQSGGAVLVAFTEEEQTQESFGTFHSCQLDANNALYGGALYLSFGEGDVYVQHSSFSYNVAGELGGAIYSAGALCVTNTVFVGNAAGTDGLAVYNFKFSDITLEAKFRDNMFSCPAGEYSDHQDTSTGVQRSSTSVTLAEFNLMAGYYRVSNDSGNVLECYQPDAVDATNYCATGYEGPYCAVCADGMAPGFMRRCHECSGADVRSGWFVLAALSIVATLVVVAVGWNLLEYVKTDPSRVNEVDHNARPRGHCLLQTGRNLLVKIFPISAVKIVVVVLEIITQFTEIAGNVYPDEYEVFVSKITFSNIDIGFILSTFCIVRTNFYDRLLVATVGPLVFLLALASTYIIAKKRNRNSELAPAIVKYKHLSTVLFATFILYSSVCFTIFQTFVCDTLDDGGKYLRADYSISCKTAEYETYWLYAILMVTIYPVGIPVAFGSWLLSNRQDLEKPDREAIAQLKPFRGLWATYRPSRCYYELVEYGRRVMLTGAAVFFVPGSPGQIAATLLLAVVFMFISESLSPFESRVDMWMYRWGNGIILASMYVALLHSVDITGDETAGTHSVSALLIAANTVLILVAVAQALLALKAVCVPVEVTPVDCPLARKQSVRSVYPTV